MCGIYTDSRSAHDGKLFLALRGENFDGHHFVQTTADHGAVGAIVEKGFDNVITPSHFALLEVEDTLLAYHKIAARYRQTLSAKVIAITGSNGKTSTKDFIAEVLARKYRVLKTEGNLNNHIGVPQTLLRASPDDEIIVLEMGMNHPGEIAPLANMARPDVAIITNIGTAHIEFMGSRAGIAQEKGTLAAAIDPSGHVILSSNDDFSAAIATRTTAQVILVGGRDADICAEAIEEDLSGSRFTLVVGDERVRAALPIAGRHMVSNALFAIAAGRVFGVPINECVSALSEVRSAKARMEWKNVHGLHILDDSYNANPDSMVAALETLARMPTSHHRVAILGKMGELGNAATAGYQRVGNVAVSLGIDLLVGVGSDTEIILQAARASGFGATHAVADADEAAHFIVSRVGAGDLVLIKGSRSAALEQILPVLERLLDNSNKNADLVPKVASSCEP